MRQFYVAYRHDKKVSALLAQLPWTHNLIILGQSKRPEEREFYLRMSLRPDGPAGLTTPPALAVACCLRSSLNTASACTTLVV